MYRIGLIGCGYMGQAHLQDCCSKENIDIYAVCDSDRQKAEETAGSTMPQEPIPMRRS